MPERRENRGLSLADIRNMNHAAICASRAGRALNWFLSIRAPEAEGPKAQARTLQQQRARIGQRLKRSGVPAVALHVRERKLDDPADVREHLHSLVSLPPSVPADLLLKALTPGVDAHIEMNRGEQGITDRLQYVQKQRDGQAEGFLKLHHVPRYPREKPAPLVGARWGMSAGLRAMVAADAGKAAQRPRQRVHDALADQPVADPTPVVVAKPNFELVADPIQLNLFGEPKPVNRLRRFVGGIVTPAVAVEIEWRRHRRGMTQEAVAKAILISRPQLTNALQGRFGLSNWAANRLREFLLFDDVRQPAPGAGVMEQAA